MLEINVTRYSDNVAPAVGPRHKQVATVGSRRLTQIARLITNVLVVAITTNRLVVRLGYEKLTYVSCFCILSISLAQSKDSPAQSSAGAVVRFLREIFKFNWRVACRTANPTQT